MARQQQRKQRLQVHSPRHAYRISVTRSETLPQPVASSPLWPTMASGRRIGRQRRRRQRAGDRAGDEPACGLARLGLQRSDVAAKVEFGAQVARHEDDRNGEGQTQGGAHRLGRIREIGADDARRFLVEPGRHSARSCTRSSVVPSAGAPMSGPRVSLLESSAGNQARTSPSTIAQPAPRPRTAVDQGEVAVGGIRRTATASCGTEMPLTR